MFCCNKQLLDFSPRDAECMFCVKEITISNSSSNLKEKNIFTVDFIFNCIWKM